jgi:hypothetical protein
MTQSPSPGTIRTGVVCGAVGNAVFGKFRGELENLGNGRILWNLNLLVSANKFQSIVLGLLKITKLDGPVIFGELM